MLLREVFLAGSLTKLELVKSLVELKRNLQTKKATSSEIEKEIDELTLHHYLIGVSATSMTTPISETEAFAKKRDQKKAAKEKIKAKEISQVSDAKTTALRLNFARFVAEERKIACIALAEKKIS